MKKRPKKVEIVWKDHHACIQEGEPTDPEKLAPQVWRSTGYLVSQNAIMVEIVRDISDDGSTAIDGALRIMRDCIISPDILKKKEV